MKQTLSTLAAYLDHLISDEAWNLMGSYERWLLDEALTAGGIGPGEAERIRHRHIGDSISYAAAFAEPPESLTDYGSGVGLPGIPLAILWPETAVLLVDRARRRVELMQRAVRVLGLGNVSIAQVDAAADRTLHRNIVTRAVFRPDEWLRWMAPRLEPGGTAVTSLGFRQPKVWHVEGEPSIETHVLTLPPEVLDHRVTFLIMTRSSP